MEFIRPHSIPHQGAGYLEGQLLVATPLVQGSCFARAVIFICAHSQEGAMGLIINHVVDSVNFDDVLKQVNVPIAPLGPKMPVHFGGPVETNRGFVLHSSDYSDGEAIMTVNGFSLTSNINILRDITDNKGPTKSMLILGYSGWAAGQLENEIQSNSWITVPANAKLVFETDNEQKWENAAASLGVDLMRLSGDVGHA